MSGYTPRMTPKERAADKAAKLEERLERREQLKLNVVEDFLRGKLSFKRISSLDAKGPTRISRAFPRLDKMLVAWTLILARPLEFGFRLTDNGLVGQLSRALDIIYPDDSYILDESLKYGLHIKHNLGVRATPSIALVALVQEHINTPVGGIAQYFQYREQEPPTELDIEVIRAVCSLDDVASRAQDTRAQLAAVTVRPPASQADPRVEALAQRALEELQELYGPRVLAVLKRML